MNEIDLGNIDRSKVRKDASMRKRAKVLLPCVLAGVIIGALVGSNIYSRASDDKKIKEGIKVEGIELGGLTEKEAEQKISEYTEQVLASKITLKTQSKQVEATAKQLGITWSNTDLASQAYNVGRCGNLIQRYKALKDLENSSINMDCVFELKKETFQAFLTKNKDKINLDAIDSTLKRENKAFVVVDGQIGNEVEIEASTNDMKEFVDKQWDQKETTITLKTKDVKPRGTREELEKVKNVLGEFTTNFSTSTVDRAINVGNGAKKINASLLYPGDTLSVNKVCGPFTIENGYAVGGAFENGQIVDSIGGGICQVSTTLYNAALFSEVGIEKRFAHSMVVTYVDVSRDAAIAGDYKDLVIKNTLNAPIYIEGIISGRNITFRIYGMETRNATRKITLLSETLSKTDAPAPQIKGISAAVGTVVKTQPAHIGYKAKLWKIVTENGKEISREEINKSTYMASPEVYEVGIVSSHAEAVAAINAAIASKDIAKVKEAAAYWSDAAIAARTAAQTPPAVPTPPAAPAIPPTTP